MKANAKYRVTAKVVDGRYTIDMRFGSEKAAYTYVRELRSQGITGITVYYSKAPGWGLYENVN